jgi:hypothetical protein
MCDCAAKRFSRNYCHLYTSVAKTPCAVKLFALPLLGSEY